MRLTDKKPNSTPGHDQMCLGIFNDAWEFQDWEKLVLLHSRELEAPAGGGFIDVLLVTASFEHEWGDAVQLNSDDVFVPQFTRKRDGGVTHARLEAIVVEVKTEHDEQSPAAWIRQMKRYGEGILNKRRLPMKGSRCQFPGTICSVKYLLVSTFALSELQKEFLSAEGIEYIEHPRRGQSVSHVTTRG